MRLTTTIVKHMEISYKIDGEINEELVKFAQELFTKRWERELSVDFYELIGLLKDVVKQGLPISPSLEEDIISLIGDVNYENFLSETGVWATAKDYFKSSIIKDYVADLVENEPRSKQEITEIANFHFSTSVKDVSLELLRLSKSKDKQSVDNSSPEAPEDGDLGKWAFAQSREGVPYERNTDAENALEDKIKLHLDDTHKLHKSVADEITSYIKDNQYLTLLRFPAETYEVAFRGMSLPVETFQAIFGFTPDENGETGVLDVDVWASPRADTASWTIDTGTARNFAVSSGPKTNVAVVLAASTIANSGKFILNPERLYDVEEFSEYEEELETIGIGPIKVNRIAYAFPGTATLLTPSLVDKLAGYT